MTDWRVHGWVLMSNHYHLCIETPEANLVAGMQWLQNTVTRRFNVRHRKWGRLFGDRYKAILVEGGSGYGLPPGKRAKWFCAEKGFCGIGVAGHGGGAAIVHRASG